jgi:hypothetical protein
MTPVKNAPSSSISRFFSLFFFLFLSEKRRKTFFLRCCSNKSERRRASEKKLNFIAIQIPFELFVSCAAATAAVAAVVVGDVDMWKFGDI